MKHYIICARHKETGKVVAYADNKALFRVDQAILFHGRHWYTRSDHLRHFMWMEEKITKFSKMLPGYEVFIARVGSKKCPFKVHLKVVRNSRVQIYPRAI